MVTFEETKEELLRRRWKFIDRSFPADERSLGEVNKIEDVVWKRPGQLCEEPRFMVDGFSRLDLVQGEIANCWFISAAACLAFQRPEDFKWCVPLDQSFQHNYAGIFRFRFWEFGSWVEIYIDDQLPTKDGKLIFGHNRQQPNEFWVPLFEKAYAKLKGKYSYLDGGQTTFALVDFTGGITERVDLKAERLLSGKLFHSMLKMSQKDSMMGCEIVAKEGQMETKLSNGLYTGHAYSISRILQIPTRFSTTRLLRIRNPWGELEWSGAWADGSKQWDNVSEDVMEELGMMKKDDGEFWMSYEDWLSTFEYLTICHLEPGHVRAELEKEGKSRWSVNSYHNEWISGFNAGGSSRMGVGRDNFFSNPQFKLSIPSPPSSSSSSSSSSLPSSPSSSSPPSTTIIVSLMQLSRSWDEQKIIGFDIYKVKEGVESKKMGEHYNRSELSFEKNGYTPAMLREVTSRLELRPGNYVVIPYTLERNKSSKFLLRIYTEEAIALDDDFNTHTAIVPQKDPHFIERERLEELVKRLFERFAPRATSHMDARELLSALDYTAKEDGWPGFESLEAARCLVSVFGVTKAGFVSEEEVRNIMKDLQYWTNHFVNFDTDKSGTINYRELSRMYSSIGIQASYKLVRAIVGKYAGRGGEVSFDEFALCSCKIKHTYDVFKRLCEERKVDMDLEEWMTVALTL